MQWNLKLGVAITALSIALSAQSAEARYTKRVLKPASPKVLAQASPAAMPEPMAYPGQAVTETPVAMPTMSVPDYPSQPDSMPTAFPAMAQDSTQHDDVARASVFNETLPGYSASYAALSVPSYAEITRLDNGKTILIQIASNNNSANALGLSTSAAQALGITDGMTPVRVRKVSPPEEEQSALRFGQKAGDRLETPEILLVALRKKYAALGSSIAVASAKPSASAKPNIAPRPVRPAPKPVQMPVQVSSGIGPSGQTGADYQTLPSRHNDVVPPVATTPVEVAVTQSADETPKPSVVRVKRGATVQVAQVDKNDRFIIENGGMITLPSTAPDGPSDSQDTTPNSGEAFTMETADTGSSAKAKGAYYVQVAAFSNPARASTLAQKIGGKVIRAKSIYRVKMGPYANAQDAQSAISTASARGFPGARIMR